MKAGFIVVAALTLALAGEARATSLTGTVRDAQTLAPIAGAYVTLHIINPDSIAVQMVSDGSGNFGTEDVTPENEIYVLLVSAAGYAPLYARLDGLATTDLVYDPLLVEEIPPPDPDPTPPDSGAVSGAVWSQGVSGHLTPIVGASVTLVSGGTQFEIQTDAFGRYSSIPLPLGTYSVHFEATGYEDLTLSGVELQATGVVVDGVLSPNPTPALKRTWGSVKATYR